MLTDLRLIAGKELHFTRHPQDGVSVTARGSVDDLDVLVHELLGVLSGGAEIQQNHLIVQN